MEICGLYPEDGVSVIDPRHLSINKLPPPVHVEQIAADHKTTGRTLTAMHSPRPEAAAAGARPNN